VRVNEGEKCFKAQVAEHLPEGGLQFLVYVFPFTQVGHPGIADDGPPGLLGFAQAFVAPDRQPAVELIDVLGLEADGGNVEVERFARLDIAGDSVVF
jgi:hypothetical protein